MANTFRVLLVAALALVLPPALAAEPLFTQADDGSTFLYRARAGDQPGTVAAMFGIGPQDLPAFLAANGITDPTRVGVGHLYRIPNPLAGRAASAEANAQATARELAELRARATSLDGELHAARAAAGEAEQRAARLARLERLWPLVITAGVLLVLAGGASIAFAVTAMRKNDEADRYARTLAGDLDEKRRGALAERQEAARHVLDLEAKVRDLELQLKHGATIAPRRSPAGTG
jgi:hypothetical protein